MCSFTPGGLCCCPSLGDGGSDVDDSLFNTAPTVCEGSVFCFCFVTVNSVIFERILFSRKASKDIFARHICDLRNSRLWHDLLIAVNDGVL